MSEEIKRNEHNAVIGGGMVVGLITKEQ
ncbi:uncharacterized protein METZ01_LOCUS400276 [marine metagenome]|uniref:Uncharacterized protein n=1 Tax=marine metagenome TaxID=408172 RepID=A0A382VLM1_9ZZZZ